MRLCGWRGYKPLINKHLSLKAAPSCTASVSWQAVVERWYPKLQQRAYFVPPVHFNRFNYDRTQVVGEAVTQRPIPSHTTKGQKAVVRENEVREDRSQERLLHCFKKFAAQHNQVMFVLSQLSFTGYLGEPSYAAAAKKLPRPIDLKAKNFDRGDFDILFIHRDFGLVAAEVKCIGDLFSGDASSQPSEDKALAKRIEQAVKQMDKSDEVLKHLTSDLGRQPSVTKTLMLPNVARCQLRRVLLDLPQTKQVHDMSPVLTKGVVSRCLSLLRY